MLSRAVLASLALAVVALVAAGCGGGDDNEGGGASVEGKTLTVGSDIPFPPFEQGQAPNYTGFDIELVDEIAKRGKFEVKFEDTAFDTIFTDLANGKFDMVASATTITPDRQKTVDFSDPYYEAQQALLVPTGSDIKSVEDLAGKTVGAQDATTGETYANDETDASSVNGYPQAPDAINALRSGQVEAVIIDAPVAEDAVSKSAGVEVATNIPTGELYGLVFNKNDDDLREQVNGILADLKSDGTLEKLYDKWFSLKPPKSVLEGKTAPKA